MRHIWSITAKELRGYFHSPVALIFLATFLAIVLFTFFWGEGFFARGLADVRPLFDWLPLLLIFLVAALTMRMWSEEQKLGTLEVLMTLPVPLHKLVLGKFLAGLILVALALAMTLGLPITVSMMGDLDWGPVVGGYLGALLLAAAYLALGLCVSSLTDNQIVALIFTAGACLLLYLPGAEAVVGFFGHGGAELLRALGTGSRFESIARGVVDVRDLAYYGGLVVLFLALNTAILHAKRWSAGSRSAARRKGTRLAVALVLANVLALNLWLHPVGAARADLTEDRLFSLSPVTENILRETSEPLVIRAYISRDTHPYLAPIIPYIRDILDEYEAAAGRNVTVEFVDPLDDEALEEEARETYGIESMAFQFAGRDEARVVNAYFSILVEYGDQTEILEFDDLVEVRATDPEDIEVQPSNLEYNITRAVRRASRGFESIDNLFASLADDVRLTLYVTPDTLPQELGDVSETIEAAATAFARDGGERFEFRAEVPEGEERQRELAQEYGFEPLAADLFAERQFYLHLLVEVGERAVPLPLVEAIAERGDLSEADVEELITEGIKRAAPGFLQTIGFVAPEAEQPMDPHGMGMQQQPRAPQNFQHLRDVIEAEYAVEDVDPDTRDIPSDIDAIVLAGPEGLSEEAVRRLDQFLMRGGGLIVLAGRHRLDLTARDLMVEPVTTGLEDALSTYGIEVSSELVLDEESDTFPIPVERQVGATTVREMELVPYPFFVHARPDQLSDESLVTGGLQGLVLHFASPLFAEGDEEVDLVSVATSSEASWVQSDTNVRPDRARHPETGFGRPDELEDDERGPFSLVATAVGRFESHLAAQARREADEGEDPREEGAQGGVLTRSTPDARLAVVGSSSAVSDELFQLARQTGSDLVSENFRLVQNLVDWSVADTELLEIRTGGRSARVLDVPEDERRGWEYANYFLAGLFLLLVSGWTAYSRRTLAPMTLAPEGKREGAKTSEEGEA